MSGCSIISFNKKFLQYSIAELRSSKLQKMVTISTHLKVEWPKGPRIYIESLDFIEDHGFLISYRAL